MLVLRYYPPAAQHMLGSPWIGPNQVVRHATGHTVGIQKGPETPIVFVHVDDLKLCSAHETSQGIPALQQLNQYVPVRWLFDWALMLVTLPLHRQWMCLNGMR